MPWLLAISLYVGCTAGMYGTLMIVASITLDTPPMFLEFHPYYYPAHIAFWTFVLVWDGCCIYNVRTGAKSLPTFGFLFIAAAYFFLTIVFYRVLLFYALAGSLQLLLIKLELVTKEAADPILLVATIIFTLIGVPILAMRTHKRRTEDQEEYTRIITARTHSSQPQRSS